MTGETEGSVRNLIGFLVRHLVDQPDEVRIRESEAGDAIAYEIAVAREDIGKVIGKGGRIANALRTVARAAALKDDRKVSVEIDA